MQNCAKLCKLCDTIVGKNPNISPLPAYTYLAGPKLLFIVPYVESGDVNYRSTQRCRRYFGEVHGGKSSVEAGVDSDDQSGKFDH